MRLVWLSLFVMILDLITHVITIQVIFCMVRFSCSCLFSLFTLMGSDLSRNQRITCVFNLLIKFSMLIFLFSLQSIFFNVLTAHELHTDQTKTEFAGCVMINRVLPNSAIRDEMICLSAVDFAVGNYSSTKLPSESENVRLCHCWLVHFQWLVIRFCITPCIMHQRQQHTFRHWLRTLHIFHHNVSGMEIWSQWHQWLWTDTQKKAPKREKTKKNETHHDVALIWMQSIVKK